MTAKTNEKSFFYNRLQTQYILSDEKKEEILKFFNISKSESMPALNLDEKSNKEAVRGEILLLRSFEKKSATNGNPFIYMEFNNSNGVVKGRLFDRYGSVEKTLPLLEQHSVFIVDGSVNEYQGAKSLNIDQIMVCDKPIVASNLLPKTTLKIEELLFEMFYYLDNLKEPHRTIGLKGLQRYWLEFSTKPAAKGHHHAYISGLLKHTLGLMRITKYIMETAPNPYEGIMSLIQIAEEEHKKAMLENLKEGLPNKYQYMTWANSIDHLYQMLNALMEMDGQEIDTDLIIACEFYHDIGKIFEYSNIGEAVNKFDWLYPNLSATETYKKGGIDMDQLGKLMGHMAPGIMLLSKTVEDYNIQISLEDMVKYNHLILAHHGKLEWGANVKPMLPEAIIIHLSDFFDSRWEKSDPVN